MKTYNVRSRQWRRYYRQISRLETRAFQRHFKYLTDNPGVRTTSAARIVTGDGVLRHHNKMCLGKRKYFWIPVNS